MRKLRSPFRSYDTGEIRIYNWKQYFSRNPQKLKNIFAMEVMPAGEPQNPNCISIPRKVWNTLSKA